MIKHKLTHEQSPLEMLKAIIHAIYLVIYFLLFLFIFIGNFLIIGIKLLRKTWQDSLSNNYLIFRVNEHRNFWSWIAIILSTLILITTISISILSYFGNAEEVINLIKQFWLYYIALLILSILTSSLLLVSQTKKIPKLNTLLEILTPEKIIKYPESSVRQAFVFFEEKLRQKMDSKKYGIPLIQDAFNKRDGRLVYEGQENILKMAIALYFMYRNPLAHNNMVLNEQENMAILILIDKLIQIINKSEIRETNKEIREKIEKSVLDGMPHTEN